MAGLMQSVFSQYKSHLISSGIYEKVVMTCSPRNTDVVKQHGADEVIDYATVTIPTFLSQT